ncbi:MAG: hypothetical protein HKO68_18590, partial [Desulfobacterales bacterium]|nr:hypothetical protein [Desulfobacterales bacterium]
MRRILSTVILTIVSGLVCLTAYAEDSSSDGNWDFTLAPMYLWAVSIDGDQTVNGVDVDLDVSFSDIFDKLNGALTFHFEGLHKQRWGFFTDLNYIVLEMDDGAADIDFTEIMFELAGFYRVTEGQPVDAVGAFR